MTITIGARIEDDTIVCYAVVNGVASKTYYSGPEGRRKALAEATAIEFNELLKELASKEWAHDLAALEKGHGLTITITGDRGSRYSFTDASGQQFHEGVSSAKDAVDLARLTAGPHP